MRYLACRCRPIIAAVLFQRDQQLADLQDQIDTGRTQVQEVERERIREACIVSRVWQALGIVTYEQAEGLSVDEHVTRLRTQLDAVTRTLEEERLMGKGLIGGLYKEREQLEADLLALQLEHGRVVEAMTVVSVLCSNTDFTANEVCARIDNALSSPSPSSAVGEAIDAIAEAIEDEWCRGGSDETHARRDCTACNLASALRALGLGRE